MKKMIFHLPYKPNKSRFSASQIRPFLMIKGFEELGYRVFQVMGDAKERAIQIQEIKFMILNGDHFELMYSESSTMPTLLTESHHLPTSPLLDFGFFKFLRKNKIPLGLFYRDIHWRFEHYHVHPFKKWVSSLFYKHDLNQYKKLIDVLFLPSLEMGEYIPELKHLDKVQLPPGSDVNASFSLQKIPTTKHLPIRLLYVGGLGDLYNLELILETIESLPRDKIRLTICTRKDDLKKVSGIYSKYFQSPHIQWVHKGGDQLSTLYQTHDVCCLFVKPSRYWSFAMPVKLFEYLAYQKPILAVRNTAAGNFVVNQGIGWAINYEKNELKEFLDRLLNEGLQDRTEIFFRRAQENSWKSRADAVRKSLVK
jgi:glycosyltransferase involved in cell wall biosynthesis